MAVTTTLANTPTLRLGFVLITHQKPRQILRLITTLDRMFEGPPIVCHHDFTQSALPTNTLGQHVSFVRPHHATQWGRFSVVEATLEAMRLMFEGPDPPDWFVLLSGADYPIKPARTILQDLASSPFDVHLQHERVRYDSNATWQRKRYDRYCTLGVDVPGTHLRVRLRHPRLTAPFLPFSETFRCFAGEHWFYANRKATNYLLEFHRTEFALARHYRRERRVPSSPDESYYHTVLCNAAHIRVSTDNRRYIDWSGGGNSPKTLSSHDLPRLRASSAHFARKFDMDEDPGFLDELDALVQVEG